MDRGKCPVCFYRVRLRKDGTLQAHRVCQETHLTLFVCLETHPTSFVCRGSHQKTMEDGVDDAGL